MKIKALLTILTTLALGFNAAIAADDDTPLAKNMSAMNKSLRMLKRQLSDASKKDENVGILEKVKTSLVPSFPASWLTPCPSDWGNPLDGVRLELTAHSNPSRRPLKATASSQRNDSDQREKAQKIAL